MVLRSGTEKLMRPCTKCGEKFTPKTRYTRLCQDCNDIAFKRRDWKNRLYLKKYHKQQKD